MVVSGLVVSALAGGSVAQAAFPGRNGRLAVSFGFACEEGRKIARMRADGVNLRLLTDATCTDEVVGFAAWPDWSPDGELILFYTGAEAVMQPDGSGQALVPLATSPGLTGDKASFAPDGRHFAYTRQVFGRRGPEVSIYRAATDGSDDRLLRRGSMPRWSPNGRRIAYVAPEIRNGGLRAGGTWIMNAHTGERIRRISRHDAAVLDWAPDGRTLLFAPACGDFCDWDLFILRRDGKVVRRVTDTPKRQETDAVWSPNGRRIALGRMVGFRQEVRRHTIWTMTARGTRERRIFRSESRLIEGDSGAPQLSWRPRPR